MKKIIIHILTGLNLYPDITTEEKLNNILNETKHERFLQDIRWLRTRGDYVPNYNAAPKYSEYNIQGINWKTRISAEPTQKCKSMEEWRGSISAEIKKLYQFM
jgi:hypothetical protein